MVRAKSFVKVYSGIVHRGPSSFRELETDRGTWIGGVDFVQDLASLDKRRHYYVELHAGTVKQAADVPGGFSLTFDPIYRPDSNERLTITVGDAENLDRFRVENGPDVLAFINSRPNGHVTLIVASSEEDVNLSALPKPIGDSYTD